MPFSAGVRFTRFSRCGSERSRSPCASSRATSADWLNPRCHSRLRCSGTGTRIALVTRAHQRRHVARHRSRKRDLPPVLQPDRDAPRQFVIGDGRTRPLDPRRLRDADAAFARRPSPRAEARRSSSRCRRGTRPASSSRGRSCALRRRSCRSRRSGRASAKSSTCLTADRMTRTTPTRVLSPLARRRTSAAVTRICSTRDCARCAATRALRRGPELFLHERELRGHPRAAVARSPTVRESAADRPLRARAWRDRLLARAQSVDVIEPDELMTVEPGCLRPVRRRRRARHGQRSSARLAGDPVRAQRGFAVHRRIARAATRFRPAVGDARCRRADGRSHARTSIRASSPPALTQLLTSAGFSMPVVDVDRVEVSYESLSDLVRDLRAMGATNIFRPGRAAR